jgi:hypothetical protein
MIAVGTRAAEMLYALVAGRDGVDYQFRRSAALQGTGGTTLPPISVVRGQYSVSLNEKKNSYKYPHICVYCSTIENNLRKKFQRFSGTVTLAIEVRHSANRVEETESLCSALVDSVIAVLDGSRGEWGPGFTYSGAYTVRFDPVVIGGVNYCQTARIEISVDANLS